MFLFKCCSNHSLPNFLKSSKGQPQPIRNQASTSSPNFQGRCSDEVVTDFSAQTSGDILDDSIDFIDHKKETASFEDLSYRPKKSSQCRRKIVINSLKKPQLEVHSSSSNSIVVLVEDNKVKTKLLKHSPSLSSNPHVVDSENKTQDRNSPKTSAVRPVSKISETCFSYEESFMLKAVSIDHAEFIFKTFSEKHEIFLDESQFQESTQRVKECPNKCKVTPHFEGDIENCLSNHSDDPLCDVCSSECFCSLDNSGEIKVCKSLEATTKEKEKEFNSKSSNSLVSIPVDPNVTDSNLALQNQMYDDIGTTDELHDNRFSNNPFIQSEVESQRTLVKVSRKKIRVEDLNASPMNHPEIDTSPITEKSSHTPISKSMNRKRSSSIGSSPDNNINNSSIDIIFAGESASYLEEFLPKDDYLPIQFTIVAEDESTSLSSSEDSKNEMDTSNDSLLSDRSSTRRPCAFNNESRVEFSTSPDMEPSDESIQNNSGDNSVTDSLLESPESPSGGLDFRHFYSKSLPNLDKQPYDGISSLGLIEEYFSRYIIDSNESEDKRLGSQVDSVLDEISEDSKNCDKVYLEDQNRVHSLEKLTEICKRFSTTYLTFLQSNRSHPDLDSNCSTCVDQLPEDEKLSGPCKDDKKDQETDETTSGFTSFYAAMFPNSDSKDISRVKPASKDCDSEEPVSMKPSLVGRSFSMRECSIPGGKKVAKKKKAVKFADSFGFELAIVRLILSGENLSDQEFQQRFQATGTQCNNASNKNSCIINNLKTIAQPEATKTTNGNRKIVAEFVQPESSDEFMRRLEAQNVTLESCLPEEKSRSVSGCIRVKNLSYEKTVLVRYTLNDWLSYNETLASYFSGSSDGYSDRFSFSIKLPSFFDVGSSIEFAIMYRTKDGSIFWDNNFGLNYRMTCQKC